jgi:hypothetical protein
MLITPIGIKDIPKALKSHILIFIELGRRISMVEGNRNRCHAYPIVTIYPWLLDVVGY